jgi:UDP-N-acetylmuramate dehydrogenase
VNIQENVSLTAYSTMRLGGNARYLAEATSNETVQELVQWAKQRSLPFIMVGQGSNIVWRDEGYPGLVIVNRFLGREVLNEDNDGLTIRVSGGEKWDEVVAWAVGKSLSGIEFLSAIPGTVGAAPVQNIGAYGTELSDVLVEVEAYNTESDEFDKLTAEQCNFSYRNSRFKGADRGQFMILSIALRLHKKNPQPPFYESLQTYFEQHGIKEFTSGTVREAVIAIRKFRLPDPSVVNNNGSFFTNPLIEQSRFEGLQQKYPDIKGWPTKDGKVKISAGWLVEQAGFKGVHDEATGMATWPQSALVLVNEHARRTADLLEFRQKIIFKVDELFDIVLEQEPELLP